MRVSNVAEAFGALMVVALATTLVTSKYTAPIITAAGKAVTGAIGAAMGNR